MNRPAFNESEIPEMVRPDLVAPDPQVASIEPICVGGATACLLMSVSRKTLTAMEEQGLPVISTGGKNLYPIQGMRAWVTEQAANRKNAAK